MGTDGETETNVSCVHFRMRMTLTSEVIDNFEDFIKMLRKISRNTLKLSLDTSRAVNVNLKCIFFRNSMLIKNCT